MNERGKGGKGLCKGGEAGLVETLGSRSGSPRVSAISSLARDRLDSGQLLERLETARDAKAAPRRRKSKPSRPPPHVDVSAMEAGGEAGGLAASSNPIQRLNLPSLQTS